MLKQEAIRAGKQEERPRLLDDVAVWMFHERRAESESTYIVGSVTADRYLTVPASKLPAVRAFMRRLDGQQTLQAIRQDLMQHDGFELDVESLHRKFGDAGLLVASDGFEDGDIQRMSMTFVRLPINRLLHALGKVLWLANALTYFGITALPALLVLLVFDRDFLHLAAQAVSAGPLIVANVKLTLLIGCFSVVLHELSHCFAAACWGILGGALRIQLYLGVIPIIGMKFSGLYTLPRKGRLVVWSAGIFANLSVAAAALLALRVFPESELLRLAATINWMLAAFNLLPFLANDGYFILSTLTKDSNVRVRSWDWIRQPFRAGRQRPSWFVFVYIISTVALLVSTLRHLILRILDPGGFHPFLQSAFSTALLALFIATIWRRFRHKEVQ